MFAPRDPRSLALALFIAVAPSSGCTVAVSAVATGGMDSVANASAEGRGEVLAGVGNGDVLLYTSLGVGGGFYVNDIGYFVLVSESGLGIDSPDIRATIGATYAARVDGAIFSAVGGAASVYFRLTEDQAENRHWALGPRLSISAFEDFNGEWVGLFQLSLVVRFIAFDTTGDDLAGSR